MTTHEHVLVRSVRDTAGVLDAIVARALAIRHRATTLPAVRRRGRCRPGTPPHRVVHDSSTGAPPTHPDCVAAVEATIRVLADLGHEVAPTALTALDGPRFSEGIGAVSSVFIAGDLVRWSRKLGA